MMSDSETKNGKSVVLETNLVSSIPANGADVVEQLNKGILAKELRESLEAAGIVLGDNVEVVPLVTVEVKVGETVHVLAAEKPQGG